MALVSQSTEATSQSVCHQYKTQTAEGVMYFASVKRRVSVWGYGLAVQEFTIPYPKGPRYSYGEYFPKS